MNPKKRRLVPGRILAAAGVACLLALAGCAAERNAATAPAATLSGPRAAAVADMRAKAEAAETAPFPSAAPPSATFQHPKSVMDVAAQQAEMEVLAKRRSGRVSQAEIAALEARAVELRRLAQAANAPQ